MRTIAPQLMLDSGRHEGNVATNGEQEVSPGSSPKIQHHRLRDARDSRGLWSPIVMPAGARSSVDRTSTRRDAQHRERNPDRGGSEERCRIQSQPADVREASGRCRTPAHPASTSPERRGPMPRRFAGATVVNVRVNGSPDQRLKRSRPDAARAASRFPTPDGSRAASDDAGDG